jgi:hypothetical protein
MLGLANRNSAQFRLDGFAPGPVNAINLVRACPEGDVCN